MDTCQLHGNFAVQCDRKRKLPLQLGRAEWMTLINDASLRSKCNKDGFNVARFQYRQKSRIGILGNNENYCNTCDSVIGYGTEMKDWKWSSHPDLF